MRSATALLLVLLLVGVAACDPVEEEGGGGPSLNPDDDDSADDDTGDDDSGDDDTGDDDTGDDDSGGWDFPYYLVIGCGQSEALDLVTITGAESFSIDRSVRETGAAINQTVVHGGELYAVCSLSHSAVVYNLDDLGIEREISLGVGNNPMALAFGEGDRAYVANFVTNTVTLYDLAANPPGDRLLDTIPMPADDELPLDQPGTDAWARPGGVVRVGRRVYVTLSNLSGRFVAAGPGVLAILDTGTGGIAETLELTGRDPIAIVRDDPTDRLLIASAGDFDSGTGFVGNGGVDVVDLQTETVVDWIDTGGAPFELTICPNRKAFVGNGQEALVLSFDADSGDVLPPIDILDGEDPYGLSYASALACDGNNLLYAADFNHDVLFVIDTEDGNRIQTTLETGDGPDTMSFVR